MRMIENNNAFLMAMGDGSRIEVHASAASKDSWTQISETAAAGDSTLTLTEATGWQVGDKIAIAATGFEMDHAEERTITAVSSDGRTVTLDTPLTHTHFGVVETHNNGLSGAGFQSWDLDMRAEVALLSRNVTIQGDADSAIDGYGGHTMIMDGAAMHIDGAELTQMGQIGEVGRYPLHWHMLADASGQYVTNSSIHDTYNKGMTIHGTQNTWVENNAIYDTVGHSYYFEDGTEFGNVLMNNLGMNTNASESVAVAAIGSDHTAVSTYWVTNPNNHLIGNHAAGSDDTGFWMLSQEHAEGASASSGLYDDYSPRSQNPGQWVGNASHTNHKDGIFIGRQFDESDGSSAGEPHLEVPFLLSDFTTYKNGEFAIWMRNGKGDFEDLKVAESNVGIQLWGNSSVQDSLFVGRSSNFDTRPGGEHAGWQLYDDASHFEDVHFDGFSGTEDAAIANGWGFGRSANYSADGITFGDDVPATNTYANMLTITQDGVSDQGGPTAGGLIDLDGSLTGQAGGIMTPGIIDFKPNQHVDVVTYADDSIAASGFNATAGADWLPDNGVWVHQPGNVIGKMTIVQSTTDANGNQINVQQDDRAVYTVERSDTGAKIQLNKDAMVSYAWHVQLNADTSEGVEYVIEYADELPDILTVDLSDLPEGASVQYRFKGLPEGVVFQEADAAESIEAYEAASVTTWFREDSGDYLVTAVADRFLPWRIPRSETEIAETKIYNDEFKLFIADRDTVQPSGNGNPFADPADHQWSPADPTPLPDREASTSDTVVFSESDARWSDVDSWDGGVPGSENVVIVGPGQRVVLDADTTVKAILVNGGELIVEDTKDLALATDWVLVVNGGLFQVGTEENPFVHDFELTLEGDDAENDVDVMALISSTDKNVIRAVENTDPVDPTPTERTVYDTADTRIWDSYTDTFDADGVQLSRSMIYDDGRELDVTYVNAQRATLELRDVADAFSWDVKQTTFGTGGRPVEAFTAYDDGRTYVIDYVDGVRSVGVERDVNDVKGWEQITSAFDASGALVSESLIHDNGRVVESTYIDGALVSQLFVDASEVFDWTTIARTFDGNGLRVQQSATYDDGRLGVTDFVEGVRSLYVLNDLEDAYGWESIQVTYDADGNWDTRTQTYDNGREVVTPSVSEFALL